MNVAVCSSLDDLVLVAAAQITRLEPTEALVASQRDGLIIDIRSNDARSHHGIVPGSLHIPRTVLEWRVALDSPWRNPHLAGFDQQLILLCDHGYSSVLAASNLVQLGFAQAGDVIGGFEAWQAAGLTVAAAPVTPSLTERLPGMGGPQ